MLAYISESSGSIRHRLKDVKIQEELLTIAVESFYPSDTGSADMAGWFMVLELENERLQEVSDVVVYQAGTVS